MEAAVNGLLQEAEAGGVIVEERQHEEAAADDPVDGRRQRPEADFRVELLLELARLRLVELQAGPSRLILGQGHRRSMVCRIPALSNLRSAEWVTDDAAPAPHPSPLRYGCCGSASGSGHLRMPASL